MILKAICFSTVAVVKINSFRKWKYFLTMAATIVINAVEVPVENTVLKLNLIIF